MSAEMETTKDSVQRRCIFGKIKPTTTVPTFLLPWQPGRGTIFAVMTVTIIQLHQGMKNVS